MARGYPQTHCLFSRDQGLFQLSKCAHVPRATKAVIWYLQIIQGYYFKETTCLSSGMFVFQLMLSLHMSSTQVDIWSRIIGVDAKANTVTQVCCWSCVTVHYMLYLDLSTWAFLSPGGKCLLNAHGTIHLLTLSFQNRDRVLHNLDSHKERSIVPLAEWNHRFIAC